MKRRHRRRAIVWEASLMGSTLAFLFVAAASGATLLTFLCLFAILVSAWEYGLVLGDARLARRKAKESDSDGLYEGHR